MPGVREGRGLHLEPPPRVGYAMLTGILVLLVVVACGLTWTVEPLRLLVGRTLIALGQWLCGAPPTP